VIPRAAAGLLLALAIALTAQRAGTLTATGTLAAVVCGTLAVTAGWTWAVLLIAFFLSTSMLSRIGAREKAARTATIVAKGERRDARQVLANGGIFATAAALSLAAPWPGWLAAGAGSLAAAAADTWGTEMGTLADGRPRLITTGRPVLPGTSGAVTAPGLAATTAGALFTAAIACTLGTPLITAGAVAAGGIAGALADSLLGAVAQERRWCAACGTETEHRLHACGAPTTHLRGLAWLDNDAVNLLCSATGAAVALLLSARAAR
jgi:uncharacterized protein (TIGR00297 family)